MTQAKSESGVASAMERLLRPRSVAIVGASATRGALGASVIENLDAAGYSGAVHLVNPKRDRIGSRPCLPSIDALPEGVDCVALAIPREGVLESVRACTRRKVGSIIIFAAGFAEAGDAGRKEQGEIRRIAMEHGISVEGPNCLGLTNYVDNVFLTFVSAPPQEPFDGDAVGIVSQSGAIAAVLGVGLRHHGLPLSYSISTGNEAVCGVEDFLDFLVQDTRTKVIAMVIEQIRAPRRFLEIARTARQAGKSLVLLHPGASAEARASAATHTGALAGDYEVMRLYVESAGIVAVDSIEELVDTTDILFRCPPATSGGAAVFAESGAFKAFSLDFCKEVGLPLPPLSEECFAQLKTALPDFITPTNPLDITAQGLVDPDIYRRCIPPVLHDERYGSLMLAIILTDKQTSALKFPSILNALREVRPTKPVVFAGLDEGAECDPAYIRELRDLGVSFFPSTERAFRALARVHEHADHIKRAGEISEPVSDVPSLPAGVVPEYKSKGILRSIGVPVPKGSLARDLSEAIAIAERIGFPVVLKAQSVALSHKSDLGGVVLAVRDAEALRQAWESVSSRLSSARRDIVLDGMLVEKMGQEGVELIVGARRDPDWGHVLLVGLGGVLTEAIGDARLLMPDVTCEDVAEELLRLKGAKLLRGFRGAPPSDIQAAAKVISLIGAFVRANSRVRELDINPLVVYPEGRGVAALDALMIVDEPAGS
ncbi:MAG TPA: acetate--CoA ligase family protein [Candidatus Acidoferrales bacterium]